MGGYCNLASSPPVASGGVLPAAGAVEESKWEGVAVGAATLAKNFSSGSQRFRAVERSKSTSSGGGGGLQGVVRRAFSMRRQPSSSFADGYWRIHDDMDGIDEAVEQEQEVEGEKKSEAQGDAVDATSKKKKKGRILKACKKLLGFH